MMTKKLITVLWNNAHAILTVVLVTVAWLLKRWKDKCSMPPGPTPLPLVGNMHQMAIAGVNNAQFTLNKWAKQFGSIFTLHVGFEKCVVLNSYDVIKEAFSMHVFSGRPKNFLSEELGENLGMVFTNGTNWKVQRRFALSQLRDLGIGKMSFEDNILLEIDSMVKVLKQNSGQSMDIQYLVTNSVANIIASVLWGKRYKHDDPDFQRFLHIVNENIIACNNTVVLMSILPALRYLPGDLAGTKLLYRNKVIIESFIQANIDDHKDSLDPENLRDFLDAYLVQTAKMQRVDPDTTFSEQQLVKVLGELVIAGLETTSTTLRWALLYLTLNQDIQERARQEIHEVVGQRLPSMQDRSNLPYIEAVLTETHRLGRVVSTGVPHAPLSDVTFMGYTIPKGTPVMANMAAVFLNEEKFPDALTFKPERFLDSEGNFSKSAADHVIPFSTGRRVCLGESLARMELFLFLTTMLQNFTFTLPEGAVTPSVNGVQGFTYLPHPHELCAKTIPRKEIVHETKDTGSRQG